MAWLKEIRGLDKATFAFLSVIVNAVIGVISAFTPNTPEGIAAKLGAISIANGLIVYLGVESDNKKPE